jgi:serine/threonine protein kinase
LQDHEDNLGQDELLLLHDFSAEFKNKKLKRISDLTARNLVSQMLTVDPARRPLLSQVLAHPFFTGRNTARLVGMEPEFDVFISYRVASDAHHAELLFNLLTEKSIKVW